LLPPIFGRATRFDVPRPPHDNPFPALLSRNLPQRFPQNFGGPCRAANREAMVELRHYYGASGCSLPKQDGLESPDQPHYQRERFDGGQERHHDRRSKEQARQ